MIPVTRVPEPSILTENKDRWTARYLEQHAKNPKKRPLHAQYAHPRIVEALEGMSAHKCFYCEQSTKQVRPTVDHHIESSLAPEYAFEWLNLYLACYGCNLGKPDNRSIPVIECIDPCAQGVLPQEHLTFEAETIRARNESDLGRRTIQKYRLDRPELDLMRCKLLNRFLEVVHEIEVAMRRDARHTATEAEKERLRAFRSRDQPFSLMFRVYLDKIGPSLDL